MRDILKALLTNLADFVASDRADLLARQLTKAHDELADARAEVAALRSEMGALRAEHERQRAAHMATLRQLSDRDVKMLGELAAVVHRFKAGAAS